MALQCIIGRTSLISREMSVLPMAYFIHHNSPTKYSYLARYLTDINSQASAKPIPPCSGANNIGGALLLSSVIFKENINYHSWLATRDQLTEPISTVGVAGATGSQHTSPTNFVGLFI